MPEPRSKVRELDQKHNELVTQAQELVTEAEESGESFDEEQFDKLMDAAADKRAEAQKIRATYRRLEEAQDYADGREEPVVGKRSTRGFDNGEDRGAAEREDRVTEMAGREVRYREDPKVEEQNARQRDAFWRYMEYGRHELTRDDAEALRGGVYVPIDEKRAVLQVGTSNLGGVLAPEEFQAEFFEELKDFGGLRNIARVVQTPHGRDLEWPTLADTGNQASLVAEASTIGNSPNSAVGLVTYRAFKYQSGPMRLSREFIQDSRMVAEPLARRLLATRLGRKTAEDYMASTGGGDRPLGLINSSTDVAVTVSSSVFGFGELYDLRHSVDTAWRGSAQFLMHDDTLKTVAKITDSDGQFLLQPRVTQASPMMLLGHPVTIDNSSTEIKIGGAGSSNLAIWFGDFSQFLIRDALQVVIRRLDERFALTDEVGFIGFMRSDARMAVHSTTPDNLRPIRPLNVTVST